MKLPPALIQALGLQPTPDVVETLHYRGFVQEAAQTQQVWGLIDAGGWISLPLESGGSCLPVWSQLHEARAFARSMQTACTAGAINLPDFLDHWLPAMDSLGVQVAVQPEEVLAPVPARVLAWHLQVRCVNFPVPWSEGHAGRTSNVFTGKP